MSTSDRLRRASNGQWRQVEDGQILSAEGNDYSFQVEGRPYPYDGVQGTWYDADNLSGEQARLAYVQGQPYMPIFFSRNSRPKRMIVTPATAAFEPLEFIGWYAELADFRRTQAQLGTIFNYENMSGSSLTRFFRQLENHLYRNLGDRIRTYQPDSSETIFVDWLYEGPDALLSLGLSNGVYATNYENENGPPDDPEPGNAPTERTHEISGTQFRSLSLVGDKVYLELSYEITTTDTIDPGGPNEESEEIDNVEIEMLFCFDIIPIETAPTVWEINRVWSLSLSSLSGEFLRDQNTDIVITGGRAVALFEGPLLFHVDASDGSDPQEVDMSSVSVTKGVGSILATNIGPRAIKTFVPFDGTIIIGGDSLGLTRVDVATNSVVWTQDEEDPKGLQPLGISRGNVVECAYTEERFEVLEDFVYPLLSFDEGLTAVPRDPELEAGHSSIAGLVAISVENGAELGFEMFPGTESNGVQAQPISDYRTESCC